MFQYLKSLFIIFLIAMPLWTASRLVKLTKKIVGWLLSVVFDLLVYLHGCVDVAKHISIILGRGNR